MFYVISTANCSGSCDGLIVFCELITGQTSSTPSWLQLISWSNPIGFIVLQNRDLDFQTVYLVVYFQYFFLSIELYIIIPIG